MDKSFSIDRNSTMLEHSLLSPTIFFRKSSIAVLASPNSTPSSPSPHSLILGSYAATADPTTQSTTP